MHYLSNSVLQILLDSTKERLVLIVTLALHRCNIRRGDDGALGIQLRGVTSLPINILILNLLH